MTKKYKLVLIRHGESEWNKLNLFTGWTDVELSPKGVEEAKSAALLLKEEGYSFDLAYTSYLRRAIHTLNHVLEGLEMEYIPVTKSWKLNEKHYGALQGLNKAETALKYGDEQVKLWRRSYDIPAPEIPEDDTRNPALQSMYRNVDKKYLPRTECLKDTVERVVPYFESEIKPKILDGKKIIIAAHGNSLRALVKYLEDISDEDIISLNIPTGVPLVYELDEDFNVLNKKYLGDQDKINAAMQQVANQGKAK
ncbi:MAG: 2,3-diphosphoglycerate-dependent phosphoglycerate mutase [Bacillales bacterium]